MIIKEIQPKPVEAKKLRVAAYARVSVDKDTFDPKCEVMLTIMSSLAQEESRSISENVRWGKQKCMQDGKVSMSYSHFLGYRKGENGRPEIVPEEAEIVRDIYRMFLGGMSISNIAEILTRRSIPTSGGKTNWPVSTVRSILSNEKYKGDALLQKTYTVDYLTKEKRKNKGERRQYLVENSHDAIIDTETYEKVQAMLKDTTPMGKIRRSRHPFAYKLICADCGSYYVHKIYHRSYGNVDVWRCSHRSDGDKCQTPILREEQIKDAFLRELAKRGMPETEFNGDHFKELVDHVTVYPDGEMEFCFRDEAETANASYQMEAATASHA